MEFSIKDFFSKCDQIRSFPRIWSHLLKKALMENFIFCAVGKRVKLTNSILLIRTCNASQCLLWKFYSLSSGNNQGQGHFVAEAEVTNKGYLAEIVDQR